MGVVKLLAEVSRSQKMDHFRRGPYYVDTILKYVVGHFKVCNDWIYDGKGKNGLRTDKKKVRSELTKMK